MSEIAWSQTLADDPGPLEAAIAAGLEKPLVLWAHPRIGQSQLVASAARKAGLPITSVTAEDLENWDGFRDISESGHFREVSIEKFLARGERADPSAYTLETGAVLYLRNLNQAPTRLVQAVLDQILREGKLLNNPLPSGVRIVASALPWDAASARALLGPVLAAVWDGLEDPAPLKYPVFPIPQLLHQDAEHWAMLPSVPRFVAWGRDAAVAEEVLRFIEDEARINPGRATAELHASLIHAADFFPQTASPRAFADLGALLAERRPYFSGRPIKDALDRSATVEEFQAWFRNHLRTWEPDHWSEADSSLTLRGEPVTGSVWLRNLIEQVSRGEVTLGIEDLPTYSAFERRSLEMWATQELGDELGRRFAHDTAITSKDIAHLRQA